MLGNQSKTANDVAQDDDDNAVAVVVAAAAADVAVVAYFRMNDWPCDLFVISRWLVVLPLAHCALLQQSYYLRLVGWLAG